MLILIDDCNFDYIQTLFYDPKDDTRAFSDFSEATELFTI